MPRVIIAIPALLLLALGCAPAREIASKPNAQPARPVITLKDDLPRHRYHIDVPVTALFAPENREQLAALAAQVRADIEADLASFDIQDANTVQDYYAVLGSVATIDGQWATYLDYLQRRRALESKVANRLTMGLVGEALARAHLTHTRPTADEVAAQFRQSVAALDYAVAQDNLKSLKGRTEILTRSLVLGNLESTYQPVVDKTGGEISYDIASSLVSVDFTLRHFIPVAPALNEVLSAVIAANYVEKADIWAQRNFQLTGSEDGQPVVLAVWDSGVDAGIFSPRGQMWTNGNEIAANGIDDDGNGYIDDRHGIAYDLHANRVPELLYPIGSMTEDPAELLKRSKGFGDLQFNVDSAEASALRRTLATLPQEEVKEFLESLALYGNYSHGTHVAGIAVAGNPYARLLAGRLTFGHTLLPEEPTVEQALREAEMIRDTVAYFRSHGVRAVNMSWGGSLRSIEEALEAHNSGTSLDERKALARKIYDIGDAALRGAIRDAKDILFITSAGNDDNDVRFDEYYPSSYEFPNLLTVGAVDSAGNETSFTSLGKVDIYANGFEVESYVPGGSRIAYNGTSMSSPQVLNLAGKLLALEPTLTTSELRRLIMEGCDQRELAGRVIRLMHPRQSLALLAASRR